MFRNWNGERIAKDRVVPSRSPTTNGAAPIEIHRVRRSPGDLMQVCRASTISLIEVLVFLPIPDVTMSWRVLLFPLRQATEPSLEGARCGLDWLRLALAVETNPGVHQL